MSRAKVASAGGDGILATTGDNQLERSKVSRIGGFGFHLTGDASRNLLVGNRVRRAEKGDIEDLGEDNAYERNGFEAP